MKTKETSHLTLPAVWAPPIRTSIGEIRHLLQAGRMVHVVDEDEIQVSPKKVETLFVLQSGERIVVTERKNCPTPVSVDGVLLSKPDGTTEWLHHTAIDGNAESLAASKKQITEAWRDSVRFQAEKVNSNGNVTTPGLRPPQIGALHSIGSHWSLYHHAATIVMPTGTGKTETMLATLVAFVDGVMLVIVPSRPLKDQTFRKFASLGLLRQLGVLPAAAPNPIVGVIHRRPRTAADLTPFKNCHVIISTISALGQGTAVDLAQHTAKLTDCLVVDEAHHVAARTWSGFRESFTEKQVLQFTATPFRRDGELVDGDVIYSYPLRRAQQDNYFKPITFSPVHEIDPEEADRAVAAGAISQLKADLTERFNHLVMARCETIARAENVHAIYSELAPEYEPVLVHSEDSDSRDSIDRLRAGKSRIVVCVDMLGEGFDLPELKIAAVHDTHKSLAVLLQFTGRFTRTAGDDVGNATVIANIADVRVSNALERLYSEDADWNHLLSEFSSRAVREHTELIDFLNESERLDDRPDVPSVPR